MLLFIQIAEELHQYIISFQYISCYSLSLLGLQAGFPNICFNTSHVTLYPTPDSTE